MYIQAALGVAGRIDNGLMYALRRVAGEEDPLGKLTQLVAQAVKGDVLVVAPGDDDGLDLQGMKASAGAGGAGADGVVDVGDAV